MSHFSDTITKPNCITHWLLLRLKTNSMNKSRFANPSEKECWIQHSESWLHIFQKALGHDDKFAPDLSKAVMKELAKQSPKDHVWDFRDEDDFDVEETTTVQVKTNFYTGNVKLRFFIVFFDSFISREFTELMICIENHIRIEPDRIFQNFVFRAGIHHSQHDLACLHSSSWWWYHDEDAHQQV